MVLFWHAHRLGVFTWVVTRGWCRHTCREYEQIFLRRENKWRSYSSFQTVGGSNAPQDERWLPLKGKRRKKKELKKKKKDLGWFAWRIPQCHYGNNVQRPWPRSEHKSVAVCKLTSEMLRLPHELICVRNLDHLTKTKKCFTCATHL